MKSLETAFRFTLVLLIFNALSFDGFAQDQVRQWSSRESKETVEASFQSYDPETRQVSLQLPAGDVLVVQLRQLSRADQRYVTKVAKKKLHELESTSDETAVDSEPKPRAKAQRNIRKTSANTRTAFGIVWTPDISSALKSAAGGETTDDDRPVMWLRVLGDLNGFM